MRLFLSMIVVTTIEVILIAKVGSAIGFINTFLLIIVTAMLGSWQLRKQWNFVISKIQTMQKEPSSALLEGLIILLCGVLLITPGFLTDIVGFMGLIPSMREHFVSIMRKYGKNILKHGPLKMRSGEFHRSQRQPFDAHTIEGEFERKDD